MYLSFLIVTAPTLQKSSQSEQMNGKVTDNVDTVTDYTLQGMHVWIYYI